MSLIIYASDLHGDESRYEILLEQCVSRQAAALIIGGDLLPNSLDRDRAVALQKEFIEGPLKSFATRLREQADCALYCLLGNMDLSTSLNPLLALAREGLLKSIHSAWATLPGGLKVLGYPFVPPSPFRLKDMEKRDLSADQPPTSPEMALISTDRGVIDIETSELFSHGRSIQEDLEYLYDAMDHAHVLVTHCPPHSTSLDMIGSGIHVGCRAVREAIENHSPLLCLHGHIHESPEISGSFTDTLGHCVCVNPGRPEAVMNLVAFTEEAPAESLEIIEIRL